MAKINWCKFFGPTRYHLW